MDIDFAARKKTVVILMSLSELSWLATFVGDVMRQ
jgi:hypothetical protein